MNRALLATVLAFALAASAAAQAAPAQKPQAKPQAAAPKSQAAPPAAPQKSNAPPIGKQELPPQPVVELPEEAKGDPVLKAMVEEMRRSQTQLRLAELQRPYYIEYSVADLDEYRSDAGFGAVESEQRTNGRYVRVVVRIGDYRNDSFFGNGEGTFDVLPIDGNVLALRHQLWLATDNAYKAALEALSAKQAALKSVVIDTPVDDFSREEPVRRIGPVNSLEVNPQDWRDLLREISNGYRTMPAVYSTQASLNFRAMNRYFVNTEGTVTRRGDSTYNIYFAGATQAEDGMWVERSDGYSTRSAADLPKPDKVRADVAKVMNTVSQLAQAPMVEDSYRGPVLFAPDAAADVIHDLVARNIIGRRPPLGQQGRTTGEYASHYKLRVLPQFLTLVDDPTQTRFKDEPLLGSYEVDDEGVKAQPVTVVEDGQLVNYLMSRRPIRDFLHSNGHARSPLGGAPAPAISNLFLKAKETATPAALLQRMLEMAKDQGREYAYLVETTGPELAPRLLYRVYVKDGRRELVRGAVFGQLDTRALRSDLIAAGDDATAQDRGDPIARSIISPSLLFSELEIQRANRTREKLPDYPPPPITGR